MNLKKILLFMVLTAILLTGCALGASNAAGAEIEEREWFQASINGRELVMGTKITMTIADGQVSGSAGCNSYGGQVSLKGEAVSFKELYQTEMACMDAGVMEQEGAFLQTLAQVSGYQVAGERLKLKSAGGEVVLVFE